MSGGHWDYLQHQIMHVGEELVGSSYSPETQAKMRLTGETLILASKMMQRIDWMLSGDDGDDCLHRRWKEEGLPEPEDDKDGSRTCPGCVEGDGGL